MVYKRFLEVARRGRQWVPLPQDTTWPSRGEPSSSPKRGIYKRSQVREAVWSEKEMTSFSGKLLPREDTSPCLLLSLRSEEWGAQKDRPRSHQSLRAPGGDQHPRTDLGPRRGSWPRSPSCVRQDWPGGGGSVTRALGWGLRASRVQWG